MPVLVNGENFPRLIFLRGSPAVGKSTIGSKIASLISSKKKARIVVDDFQLYDLRPQCTNREKLAIINSALLTKNYLLEGFDVLVDYVFDETADFDSFINIIFSDTIGKLGDIYVQKFFLDAPIEVVVKRNQSRSGKRGEYMNAPLLRKIFAKIQQNKGMLKNEFVFDTTKLSAKQIARTIISNNIMFRNNECQVAVDLPQKDKDRALDDGE